MMKVFPVIGLEVSSFVFAWSHGFLSAKLPLLVCAILLWLAPETTAQEARALATSTNGLGKLPLPSPADLEAMSQLGQKLAGAITKGEGNKLIELIDYQSLWPLIVKDFTAPENVMLRAKLRFLGGMEQSSGGIFRFFMGRETKCLRVKERNGEHVVLLRVRNKKSDSFDYLEVMLTRDAAGNYRVRDFYNDGAGDSVSGVLSRFVIMELAVESKLPLLSVIKGNAGEARRFAVSVELTALLQKGENRAILDRIDAMPKVDQQNRYIQFLRRYTASVLKDPLRFQRVLDEISATYSNSYEDGMLLIDRHFTRKEYAKVLEIVNGFIQELGRDALFSKLEAQALSDMGRTEDALKALEAGLKIEEGDSSLLWSKANLLSKAKRYAETAKVMDEILDRQIQLPDPITPQIADLKGFFASPMGTNYAARFDKPIRKAK